MARSEETHHLDRELEVPLERRLSVSDEHLGREKEQAKKSKDLSKSLHANREKLTGEIQSLIGPEKYRASRGKLDAIMKKFAKVRDSEDSEEEKQRQWKKLKKEKHDFYHGLGFDHEKALKVRKDFQGKANAIVDKSLDLDLEAPKDPDAKPPTRTHNPWSWYFPPFGSQYLYTYADGSRGTRYRSATPNGSSGEIYLYNQMQLYGADDSDWSTVTVRADFGFWFRMPAAGLVEVWIYLQDINTDYSGHMWDESGCTDASLRQLSRAYLWTSGSTFRFVTNVDYHRGESEGGWSLGGRTGPGQWWYPHLFSQKSYAAGEWVWVAVGLYDYNYFWVDDMSCRSTMVTRWYVKDVAVRSTGAP